MADLTPRAALGTNRKTKFNCGTSLRKAVLAEALALAYLSGSAGANTAEPAVIVQAAPRSLPQAGDASARRDSVKSKPPRTARTEFAAVTGRRSQYSIEPGQGSQGPVLSGAYDPQQALRVRGAGTGITQSFFGSDVRLAQAMPDQGPAQLDPITVEAARGYAGQFEVDEGFKAEYQTSATKMPLPVRETPQSVSVITQDSLEARQVQDLGQALETAAGVNQFSGTGPFGGFSPFGFDEITIRGIALDGSFDTREDGFISPTFFSQPDVAIYERVEVLKGPSSSLYGRGSLAGFVNRVRKKPLPEFWADVELSGGSYDVYRAEGDITGPLFESDKARGRLVAAYEDAGSFIDGVESERRVFAPSVELDLTDSTRLLVQGLYQEDRFIPNPGFPLQQDGENFRAPDIRRSLFVGVPNEEENEWEVLTGSAQLEQQVTDNWLATLRLNRSSQDSPIDIDSYAYGIEPDGDVGLYSSAFTFDTDVWAGELRLEGNVELLDRPANLAIGVDHTDLEQGRNDFFVALGTANIYEENFADFPTVQPTTLSRDTLIDTKGTGAYAQLQFRPFERLSALLGGRYDQADSAYVDNLNDITSENEDDDFTGRAGLVFDVRKNINVYALYAESFRPVVFSVGADGEILDPEAGEIYETGIKTEWLDGKLGVNAAVFRIERDNVPIPDPDNQPGEFFSISSGQQRTDGMELEINGEPLPGWSLSFGGSLLDSDFVEESDPFFGTTPAGAADWQVGLFTGYELRSGPLQGLGLGAGLFAIDDRGVSTFQTGGTIPGYERVDLTAFYNGLKPFKVRLQIRNVFDEKYIEGADRPGAYAQFGSPTAFLLRLEYDLGDRL